MESGETGIPGGRTDGGEFLPAKGRICAPFRISRVPGSFPGCSGPSSGRSGLRDGRPRTGGGRRTNRRADEPGGGSRAAPVPFRVVPGRPTDDREPGGGRAGGADREGRPGGFSGTPPTPATRGSPIPPPPPAPGSLSGPRRAVTRSTPRAGPPGPRGWDSAPSPGQRTRSADPAKNPGPGTVPRSRPPAGVPRSASTGRDAPGAGRRIRFQAAVELRSRAAPGAPGAPDRQTDRAERPGAAGAARGSREGGTRRCRPVSGPDWRTRSTDPIGGEPRARHRSGGPFSRGGPAQRVRRAGCASGPGAGFRAVVESGPGAAPGAPDRQTDPARRPGTGAARGSPSGRSGRGRAGFGICRRRVRAGGGRIVRSRSLRRRGIFGGGRSLRFRSAPARRSGRRALPAGPAARGSPRSRPGRERGPTPEPWTS